MGAAWNEWDFDYLWHFLGGAAINAVCVVLIAVFGGSCLVPFLTAILLLVLGVVRELIQHNWEALSAHQWLEGVLWFVGGITAAGVGLMWTA
jgi:hypothetical protein